MAAYYPEICDFKITAGQTPQSLMHVTDGGRPEGLADQPVHFTEPSCGPQCPPVRPSEGLHQASYFRGLVGTLRALDSPKFHRRG